MRIDGIDLEVVMGVDPRGTYCRDPLDLSRLLDLFVLLGANLHVTLGYPSASTPDDALADADLRPRGGEWGEGFTPAAQAEWASSFARIALCKPYVRGVTWTHADDRAPHLFPHCGVFDLAGRPKPVLEPLRQLRVEHLK